MKNPGPNQDPGLNRDLSLVPNQDLIVAPGPHRSQDQEAEA